MNFDGPWKDVDETASERLVLLADDDADGRALLARALRRGGFRVVEAGDGLELIEKFQELAADVVDGGRPDVVVTDIDMPGCTGLEATAEIVRASPGTPVIVVTASDDAGARSLAMRAGAVAMMGKPLDTPKLVSLVRVLSAASRDVEAT